MKTKTIALAGMLALSLLTSLTTAQETDPILEKYANSLHGTVGSGVIKSLDDCPIGTAAFFKNVNPFLSGGNPVYPVSRPQSFLIDGKEVVLNVTWYEDNSFEFDFDADKSGIMHQLGLENNADKLIYKYAIPVGSDSGLNVLLGTAPPPSEKANHIDICISPVDIKPPVITFISPLQGEQVSGTVTVIVTVSDSSDVASVSFSVNGGTPVPLLDDYCVLQPGTQYEYRCEYDWDPESLPTGPYTLSVSATDLAQPDANSDTQSVTVDLVESFTECFGTLGDEDFGNPDETLITGLAGGCNPTGRVLIQAPPNGTDCFTNPNQPECYIAGTLLKPNPDRVADLYGLGDCPAGAPGYCGAHGIPDCRMDVDAAGNWYPKDNVALNIFDTDDPNGVGVGIDPAQYNGVLAAVRASYPPAYMPPNDLDKALVLDENTFCANGCCLAAQHTKGALLDELYQAWDEENGTAWIKVHFTEEQIGNLVTSCYSFGSPTAPDFPFLQNSFNAGYQPLFQSSDDTGFLTVLTQRCNSPARTLTRGNGFDVSNLIVGPAMPVEGDPIAVLEFAFLESREDFDRVFFLFGIINRDGLLLSGNFNRDVQNPVKEAQRKFSNFNPRSLAQSILALREAADGIRTKTTYLITEANPPGEALALIEHLIYDLGVLRDELIRVEALP